MKTAWDKLPGPSRTILTRKRLRDQRKLIQSDDSLECLLHQISIRNLRFIARKHGIRLGVHLKKDIVKKISSTLLNKEYLSYFLSQLKTDERHLLDTLQNSGGCKPYIELVDIFGSEEKDSPYWYLMQPVSILGRLRSFGFLFIGETFFKNWLQVIVCLPADLCSLLSEIRK